MLVSAQQVRPDELAVTHQLAGHYLGVSSLAGQRALPFAQVECLKRLAWGGGLANADNIFMVYWNSLARLVKSNLFWLNSFCRNELWSSVMQVCCNLVRGCHMLDHRKMDCYDVWVYCISLQNWGCMVGEVRNITNFDGYLPGTWACTLVWFFRTGACGLLCSGVRNGTELEKHKLLAFTLNT